MIESIVKKDLKNVTFIFLFSFHVMKAQKNKVFFFSIINESLF